MAGDGGGRREMVGDGGGRHNVVRPGPWLLLVGQVQEKTGRDDEMSSVLVLAQEGRTAPLRTLVPSRHGLWAAPPRGPTGPPDG